VKWTWNTARNEREKLEAVEASYEESGRKFKHLHFSVLTKVDGGGDDFHPPWLTLP